MVPVRVFEPARLARSLLVWIPLAALASGCVSTVEFRRLQREVAGLQRQAGPGGADPTAGIATRIDELTQQVRQLTGRVEVVEFQTEQALADARAARQAASSPLASAGGPGADLTPVPDEELPLGTPPAAGPGSDPTSGATSGRAPEVASREPAPARGETPLGSTSPARAPSPATSTSEEVQAYRSAYAAWRAGDADACIDQFRKFLQTHASSAYADDAAYWMADCYFKRGEYRTAILRFDDVVKRYPEGNKAPDALYRQGEALLKSGPAYAKAARQAFEQVISQYPDSPRAREAQQQIDAIEARASSTSRR